MGIVGWHAAQPDPALEQRLERGDIVPFPTCPLYLPSAEELAFLGQQRVGGIGHKNISYNPFSQTISGFERRSSAQAEKLCKLLERFAEAATDWIREALPRYATGCRVDRVSLRTEEEATRRVRLTARNDLLHVDTFPSRPTQGARILRLFVNIDPAEPRVWATSDSFADLLERFADELGLHAESVSRWAWKVGRNLLGLFSGGPAQRTDYDHFMLRLHHFLKTNEEYQERARRRFWHFGPNTAWLAFTDGFAHAELRGRFALEHSFFIDRGVLTLPQLAPASLFESARQQRRAA